MSRTRSVSVIVAGAMLFVSCGGASRGVSSAAADDPTTVDVQQRLLVVGLCEQGVVSQMISTGKDKITWTVCGQHDELSVATFATATDLATFLKDQRSFCRSGFFEGRSIAVSDRTIIDGLSDAVSQGAQALGWAATAYCT